MKLYRIKNWDTHYENSRTRTMDEMRWVPIPNKHDGFGYIELVDGPDGAAMLGGWVAIIQVASKCHPRGTLLKDPKTPHDAYSIARKTRLLPEIIQKVLDRASSDSVGWLEVEELEPVTLKLSPTYHPPVNGVTVRCEGIEEKGIEGIEEKRREAQALLLPDDPSLGFPQNLRTVAFMKAWEAWVSFRKTIKKSKNWQVMFQRQIAWLGTFPEPTAIEILNQSTMNEWQGLRPVPVNRGTFSSKPRRPMGGNI